MLGISLVLPSAVATMQSSLAIYLCLVIASVLWYIVASLRAAVRKGLRDVPGPFAARFSGWYRFSLVCTGRAPLEYKKVHEKYGPVVRVGPNHVSISDPAVIPQIYGISSNYIKVSEAARCDDLGS